MTIIAAVSSSLVLALGALTMLRDQGYAFDLRNKPSRRLFGGRRQNDRA